MGSKSTLLWDQSVLYCRIKVSRAIKVSYVVGSKVSSIVGSKSHLLYPQSLLYCGIKVTSIVGSKFPLLWDQSLFYCGIKISSIVGSKSSTVATILWPQQTVRSSCWSSMFNGIRPGPLINGLIQNTFKLYFLFLEKLTVLPFD